MGKGVDIHCKTKQKRLIMTSIEWLEQQLFNKQGKFNKSDIEQAKEMHKQEIIDAYHEGEDNIDNDGCTIGRDGAETYYQETFQICQ
jgi:hypothetical protein